MNLPIEDIEEFARTYSGAGKQHIEFQWNGKHGQEFEDRNYAFRLALIKLVVDSDQVFPTELLRDLFEAETCCSREAWGIIDELEMLGEKLLLQGKACYVMDFLKGKFQCFDTEHGISELYLPIPLLKELIDFLHEKLAGNPPDSPLIEAGIDYFKWCIKDNQAGIY
jgi:hypothetical protein